jgi:hypothetical protein
MTLRAPTFLIALTLAAASAAADDKPASGTAADAAQGAPARDADAIVLAPKKDYVAQPPSDSDGRATSVSSGVADALAAGMPKYHPPTPTPVPTPEPADMKDVDKPKNEIKRLPSYLVRETRPPVFRDRDLLASNELAKLSIQNHPGLLIGNLWGLNEAPAYEMYMDDQRLENMKDLSDTARAMAAGGDIAEGKYILQQSQSTYMRDVQGFDLVGSGGSGNNTGGGGK